MPSMYRQADRQTEPSGRQWQPHVYYINRDYLTAVSSRESGIYVCHVVAIPTTCVMYGQQWRCVHKVYTIYMLPHKVCVGV